MASGWQSKLARVSRMDWEEVWVRVGQEFHKQSDLLMHRMGVRQAVVRLNPDAAARPGQFFFSDGEFSGGESSERAELLRKHLPDEAAEILREADENCGHRFRLLGYENLDFTLKSSSARMNATEGRPSAVNAARVAGSNGMAEAMPLQSLPETNLNRSFLNSGSGNFHEIDWHLDPVHGKRAPLDPWFKIPFLDFAVVGDHKVTWELNRHQHLVTLAKARLLSGDEKYARELMAQWRSWIKANPYPLGINWGSTLEVAFRSLSWIWVDQLLAGTAGVRGVSRGAGCRRSPFTGVISSAIYPLISLRTRICWGKRWRCSFWALCIRKCRERRAGRNRAGRLCCTRRNGRCVRMAFTSSNRCTTTFMRSTFFSMRDCSRLGMGWKFHRAYDAALGRMLDVVAALAQAGPAEGFGDDDGGRLCNPRRNRTEHMTDPLALGAVIYSRRFSAAQLTEESIWLFGNQAVEKLARAHLSTQTSPAARSLAFPDGGLYVLADSQPYAQAMVVDAGPQGVGRSGHGHADALSLRLTMDGRRWLVDSGSGVYISKDPADRNTFRGTGAHNTLRVDGVDQAVAG